MKKSLNWTILRKFICWEHLPNTLIDCFRIKIILFLFECVNFMYSLYSIDYTVKLNTSMHSVLNKRFQKIMQWMLSCNSLLFKSIFRLSTIPFLNITCLDARPAPDSWRHHLSDFETLVRTEENPKVTPGNWNTRNICFSWYFACQIIRQRYMSWIFLKKGLI